MKTDKILNIIILLSVIGLLTAGYMMYTHYTSPTEGSICDISASVSCSVVNTSVFSKLFNVPVSLFGGLWFVVMGLIAWKAKRKKELSAGLLPWNILGMAFVVYLIIAEIILKTLCPFCTVVHVITLITFVLSIMLYRKLKKKVNWNRFKLWVIFIVIINIIPLIIFNVGGASESHDALATCITESGVNMYGSFRCGVCAKTRAMFGDSFEQINEIECHPQGENAQTELCIELRLE
jgi:uncharacterized membrane protein